MLDWSQLNVTVTGGAGFLGRAVCRLLRERGCRHVDVPRRRDYDLTSESGAARMYRDLRPDVVLHLAAEVGGIGANREQPGRFFYANMAMGLHLVEQARLHGIQKFVQVGTVCAYPKFAPVPFREHDIWNGYPEETNAPYGIAKKAIFVMLDAYHRQYGLKSAVTVPVNLYGPGDNFDLRTSHVIPALIRKCLEARERRADSIVGWGTGSASREFLYVDDAAEGVVRAAELIDDPAPMNLGTGSEITIGDLARLIARLSGFAGEIRWDPSSPDGQPRRCLDTSLARERLGWQARVGLEEGLQRTIQWYRDGQRRQAA
jgi:GDP-L-fucose synthase